MPHYYTSSLGFLKLSFISVPRMRMYALINNDQIELIDAVMGFDKDGHHVY